VSVLTNDFSRILHNLTRPRDIAIFSSIVDRIKTAASVLKTVFFGALLIVLEKVTFFAFTRRTWFVSRFGSAP